MTRKRDWAVPLACLFLAMVFTVSALSVLPRIANHYDFATFAGLPYRVSYAGRDFMNNDTCAGDNWCSGELVCLSAQDLATQQATPLAQVGAVPAMLGKPYPIVVGPPTYTRANYVPFKVYVQYGPDCYIAYGISGEP